MTVFVVLLYQICYVLFKYINAQRVALLHCCYMGSLYTMHVCLLLCNLCTLHSAEKNAMHCLFPHHCGIYHGYMVIESMSLKQSVWHGSSLSSVNSSSPALLSSSDGYLFPLFSRSHFPLLDLLHIKYTLFWIIFTNYLKITNRMHSNKINKR